MVLRSFNIHPRSALQKGQAGILGRCRRVRYLQYGGQAIIEGVMTLSELLFSSLSRSKRGHRAEDGSPEKT